MPWTHERPFVMHLFEYDKKKPTDLFFATRDELHQAFESKKQLGIYQRIWAGHGETADQNEWNTLAEWTSN